MEIVFTDWGKISYAEAWQKQTEIFNETIQAKLNGTPYVNQIIFCEHPHVYTLGRSGKSGNMLLEEKQLNRIGAELYHIDRGGDITYHGPGNLYVTLYLTWKILIRDSKNISICSKRLSFVSVLPTA